MPYIADNNFCLDEIMQTELKIYEVMFSLLCCHMECLWEEFFPLILAEIEFFFPATISCKYILLCKDKRALQVGWLRNKTRNNLSASSMGRIFCFPLQIKFKNICEQYSTVFAIEQTCSNNLEWSLNMKISPMSK